MFRLQNKVPEVYVDQSRDFQLFCRLYDTIFNGVKYDIDTIVNILDASKANDRVLMLLCTRVGFFPRIEIDSNVLKYIVASFPYLVSNKGTVNGIRGAINAIIKAENDPDIVGTPIIEIVNNTGNPNDSYKVYISTTAKIFNVKALNEVLRYVLPTGYDFKLTQYRSPSSLHTKLLHNDYGHIIKTRSTNSSVASSKDLDVVNSDSLKRKYSSAYDVTGVVSSTSYADGGTNFNTDKNSVEVIMNFQGKVSNND